MYTRIARLLRHMQEKLLKHYRIYRICWNGNMLWNIFHLQFWQLGWTEQQARKSISELYVWLTAGME